MRAFVDIQEVPDTMPSPMPIIQAVPPKELSCKWIQEITGRVFGKNQAMNAYMTL